MAGAPLGNQNATKNRPWRHAIYRAIEAWPEKPLSLSVNRGLDEAAHAFVSKLMETKDAQFFKELGDRLDGRPAQAIIGGDEDDPPVRHHATVEFVGGSKP